MKILVIGGGGREHAIAWKLAQSSRVTRVYAAPGNPGIARIAECLAPPVAGPEGYVQMAEEKDIDLTVVGPEAPLVEGVADALRARGRRVIGPSAAAAQLEGSKAFAKNLMREAGIPTARFLTVDSPAEARAVLGRFSFPVVLKADGLAAGKGVIIARDEQEAEAALRKLPSGRVVVEECLVGEEVSFIVLAGENGVLPFDTTQDHKAVYDGDRGPNTGGMGAYCDTRILSGAERGVVMERVIHPTLDHMRHRGAPFTGFLYAGLMMTAEGPKVLEFNVRLGDPECQPLMYRMKGDLVAALVDGEPMQWSSHPSVCVVMAAAGYPDEPRKGDVISGIEDCGAMVFHAGTKVVDNTLVTSGGRVLGVTSSGPDLQTAIENTYASVRKIHFEGAHYRTDIGRKGLKRW
jgi:phosphoribosylamine--glycine ligase